MIEWQPRFTKWPWHSKVKFQRGHSITMTVNMSTGFVMPAVKESARQKTSAK